MRHYGVYRSDWSQPEDVLVDRRVNRRAAVKLVRQLNESSAIQMGRVLPLYYCCRSDKVGEKRLQPGQAGEQ